MKKYCLLLFFITGWFSFENAATAEFIDVNEGDEYYQSITHWEDLGVLEGYKDGSFLPYKTLNRAEALKIILASSGIDVPALENDQDSSFSDVSPDQWFAGYVEKAKELGVVSGDGDQNTFRPSDTIIMAEILKIVLEANEKDVDQPFTNTPYADVAVDAWYAKYFNYSKGIGLFLVSGNENVEPKAEVTRGQLAELMYKLTQTPEAYQEGAASYYGLELHGNSTSSGELFDAYDFTAAHPTLPFGTVVRVKNLANGEEVDVRINDRGPYTHDRVIDLSMAAFEAISPLSAGVINVSVTPLEGSLHASGEPISCSQTEDLKYYAEDSFEQIALDHPLPSVFLTSEVLSLSGHSTSEEEYISAFLMDEAGEQHPFYTKVEEGGRFEFELFLPEAGYYQVGILPGYSGSTVVKDVLILEADCLNYKLNDTLESPSDLNVQLNAGDTLVSWDNNGYDLTRLTFKQSERHVEYVIHDGSSLIPHYADFEGWHPGLVELEARGAHLTGTYLLEQEDIEWSAAVSQEIEVTDHHFYHLDETQINLDSVPERVPSDLRIDVTMDPLANVKDQALITLPSGFVEEVALTSPSHEPMLNPRGVSVFPLSAKELNLYYDLKSEALHFLEVIDETGQAVLNIPLYPQYEYPLLPNPLDLHDSQAKHLGTHLEFLQNQMLYMVNENRLDHGLTPLTLDPNLNALAQQRSDDMARDDYFGHWDLKNKTVADHKLSFGITQYVSENIAKDATVEMAHYGLWSSASHRQNILEEQWQLAGFGVSQNEDGSYTFVQLFSEIPLVEEDVERLKNETLNALNEARTDPLTNDTTLNEVAQAWGDHMLAQDFFGLKSPKNQHLVDELRDANVNGMLGTYLVGHTSFNGALKMILENPQLQESRWTRFGIGIVQDPIGIIKITIAYAE